MKENQYSKYLAEELVYQLIPNTRIKNFIKNPAVIGAYAENAVRSFIKGVVDPLKVSTGAVIAPEMVEAKEKIPQIDTIIWQPNPFPGIFCSGDFALIPRESSLAILEVKRSNYSKVGEQIKKVLDQEDSLTKRVKIGYREDRESKYSSLGVVCLQEKKNPSDPELEALIKNERVVVLSNFDSEKGTVTPNTSQIMTFINFLTSIRKEAKFVDGTTFVKSS